MRVRLVMVGRTERGFVAEGLAHYAARIGRMAIYQEVVLPEAGAGDADHQRRAEAPRILKALEGVERVVLLDERGEGLTSKALAGRLGAWRDQGRREVAFVIGGAFGVSDAVRERADLVLSLSPMTFPHQLVRVLFAEQLYRAFTILKGSPYHH